MEFIGRPLSGGMIHNVHINAIDECTEVRAAIPYALRGTNEILLLDDCLKRQKKVTFYGRVDGTCPIDLPVLAWFLKQKTPNAVCRLVPYWLHAKVIWWVGQGIYIGSANLTDRAWFKNFEAGVYISEEEIEQFGMRLDIEAFFNGLEDSSFPLDEEEYERQAAHEKSREELARKLSLLESKYEEEHWKLKDRSSKISADQQKAEDLRMTKFRTEWSSSLQLIRDIGERVAQDSNRPSWIEASVPQGVQGDQFLHAYYYQIVRPHTEKNAYEQYYDKNKTNPEAALQSALRWWKAGEYDHKHEESTIYMRAPLLEKLLGKDRITSLTCDEWTTALTSIYAFGDHAAKIGNDYLGLPADPGSEAKAASLARLIDTQRTLSGRFTSREVFDFVLWGDGDVADRIWKASFHPDYKLKHVGTNIYGEAIGWARPNDFPPRNSRTSKALRALGNNIHVLA